MLKIAGTVLCEMLVYTLIKQYKPEYAPLSQLAAAAVLIFIIGDEIRDSLSAFSSLAGIGKISSEYVSVLIKVLGISLVTQVLSDMCRDSGNTSAATRLEFSGKVIIVAASLPVIKGFTELVTEMVRSI